jgi:hypothetical protein
VTSEKQWQVLTQADGYHIRNGDGKIVGSYANPEAGRAYHVFALQEVERLQREKSELESTNRLLTTLRESEVKILQHQKSDLEQQVSAQEAMAKALRDKALTCCFCGAETLTIGELKVHSGTCDKHPLSQQVAALRADETRRQLVAGMYRLALVAIAKDEALECRCGDDPYTDGEECPKCTALLALETAIDAARSADAARE